MMTNMPEVNSIGGVGYGVPGASFGGGWGGGIGGFGLFGLIGLLGGRGLGLDGGHHRDGGECCEDIKENARNLAVLSAIADNKNQTIAEGRALAGAICDAEKTNLQQFYAQAIQTANATQSIKDQLTAQAIITDSRFDALTLAGVNQTAAILAKIGQVEIDQLRDQLHMARRHGEVQETKIEINNSATAMQQQLQAQAQLQQQRDFDNIRRFDSIFGSFNQLNKATQDVVNFGVMAASGNQTSSQNNVK